MIFLFLYQSFTFPAVLSDDLNMTFSISVPLARKFNILIQGHTFFKVLFDSTPKYKTLVPEKQGFSLYQYLRRSQLNLYIVSRQGKEKNFLSEIFE